MIKVLVVDDSALMRKALTAMLQETGEFVVETARNGADALAAIPRIEPDVVTLDINMPVMDGLTCLAAIMQDHPRPVVIVSSLTDRAALITLEALELGAVDYVLKPGGTVSLNIDEAREHIVRKVRRAAGLRLRQGGVAARLCRQREEATTQRVDALAGSRGRGTARPAGRTDVGRGRQPTCSVDLVLIGASTGGPTLLSLLLSQLPADFAGPVVVAQHMPATFTGALAQRLDEQCALTVCEVTHPMTVKRGHIYVARGDGDLLFSAGAGGITARPAPPSSNHPWHPSVDRMVASALDVVAAERLIGVLLTGMGDDGADQMTRLRQGGGRTIAEAESSAVIWGMPGQLVAREGATKVLDADRIVRQLRTWV